MKTLKKIISAALACIAWVFIILGTVAGVAGKALYFGFTDGSDGFIDTMIDWKNGNK